MKKEPLLLYIFRIALTIAILIFLIMLYWSSLIVEEKLISTREELKEVKKDLNQMQSENDNIQEDLNNAPLQTASEIHKKRNYSKETAYENNLLTPDPFYQKTLPELLGKNFKPHGQRRDGSIG